jgi:hypothetical protein
MKLMKKMTSSPRRNKQTLSVPALGKNPLFLVLLCSASLETGDEA